MRHGRERPQPQLPPQLCAASSLQMPLGFPGKAGKGDEPQARRPAGDKTYLYALGWRVKGHRMNATSPSLATGSASRTMQLALAGLLGVFVIGFVGFSHMEALHNAGHDYRHSMAFPCH